MSDNATGAGLFNIQAPAAPAADTAAPAPAAPAVTTPAATTTPAVTTTPAAPAATTAAPAAPAAPTPAIPWLPDADDLTVGFIQNKGWKTPGDMLKSYSSLESMFGHDRAGNTVVLPKEGAPKEEVDAFYRRLGRPDDPSGYGIAPADGTDATFSKTVSEWFHKHNISKSAAQGIAQEWNDFVVAQQTQQAQQNQMKLQQEQDSLKTEWGMAYTQNYADAERLWRATGITDEELGALTTSLGYSKAMKFLSGLGKKLNEPAMHTGGAGNDSAAITPQQAMAKIDELRRDRDFSKKLTEKNADAVREWDFLHKMAYPPKNGGM